MPGKIEATESSLVNDEMNEIMGSMPPWGMRWGSVLLLITILLLFGIAYFIRYPDIIDGKATILPLSAPVDIMLPAGAKVKAVLVQEHSAVKVGQPLLLLAPADTLLSTVAGNVILQQEIDTSAFARPTLVMSIEPFPLQFNATVSLPAAGSGNIHIGQRVNINLDSYPTKEFGSLTGVVVSKPLPAAAGMISLNIRLDNGSTTNYHKQVDIYKGATGQASVIIEEKSLLQRLFHFLH